MNLKIVYSRVIIIVLECNFFVLGPKMCCFSLLLGFRGEFL